MPFCSVKLFKAIARVFDSWLLILKIVKLRETCFKIIDNSYYSQRFKIKLTGFLYAVFNRIVFFPIGFLKSLNHMLSLFIGIRNNTLY